MVHLPEPFASIPRCSLLFPGPAPIEPLDNLTRHILSQADSGGTHLFVKREDANSGLGGSGGNKLRKLEYVLADALAQTPRPSHLITEGGTQSNHVRQVTAAAAKLNIASVLLVGDRVPSRSGASNPHSEAYKTLGNVQLTQLMSATHKDAAQVSREEVVESTGGYWIPSGASTHPLGGLGYARWAFEIAEQEDTMGVAFDVIVVALMSGSTLGGMVAGFKLIDEIKAREGKPTRKRQLIGVQAGPKDEEDIRRLVLQISRTAAAKIGLEPDSITASDFHIDGRWHGGAYGEPTERTKEHIKLAASSEGLVTDPVYSGKALTGLCEMVRAGEVHGNILFVHTGGVLSLSAYPDLR